jgi:phosphoglucomutase
VISTIVTSDLIKTIANANGLRFIETLTGFKFIGEQITALKKKGGTFLFGCEESYGYLLTDEVRDKDAFQGMLIVAEMASFYKSKGHTLIDELALINSKYGYYQEKLLSIDLFGIEGLQKINAIMDLFRTGETPLINALGIESIEDYLSGQVLTDTGEKITLQLPKSDVIKFSLVKGGYFALRPSGTEPKLKIYLSIAGSSSKQTDKQLHLLENTIMQTIKEAGLL